VINFAAFPPSFGGDLLLYTWALGSITTLAAIALMIAGWMARDLWRDRYRMPLNHPVSLYRLVFLLVSITGFMRSMPEAAYLYCWNEVRDDQWQLILTVKRLVDGLAIFPGAGWAMAFAVSYPPIVHALKAGARYAPVDVLSPWHKLIRPAMAGGVAFAIAFLVAISKLYLGVAGGAT
jgi:hypothetical protein